MLLQQEALKSSRKVVCVDDEPLVRQALHRLLRKEPYDLFITGAPDQALQYVREHPVSLVITDQRMPEMSGVELLESVHRFSPATRGIILTAYPESVFESMPRGGPPAPLVAKPWDDDTLRRTIRQFLRQAGPATATCRVLVPLDGSKEAEAALAAAMPLVRSESDAGFVLLRVLDDPEGLQEAHEYLSRVCRGLGAQKLRGTYFLRMGDPAEQIVSCAEDIQATHLSISTYGKRSFASSFGGSLTERVLRRVEVPLIVCRPEIPHRPWSRIALALDGSPEAETVLPEVERLAKSMIASIVLIRVAKPGSWLFGGAESLLVEPESSEDPLPYLRKIATDVEARGLTVETVPLYGSAAPQICAYLEREPADLLCLATHGRTGFSRWMSGSVTEEILPVSPCPVYVRRILRS